MKYIAIRLPIGMVKQAIYERNAGYFKGALLSRLAEAAISEGRFNWRCVGEKQDVAQDSVVLLFEEAPDSHPETALTHKINRLLEERR